MSYWLFATDELTVALGLGLAAVFLLSSYLAPQSLVHPILLGRQSDVERVRKPGESAVYRNYGTGLTGRLPMRPLKEVLTVSDFVRPELQTPRTLWSESITNEQLQRRAASLGTALVRDIGLVPKKSNVLLLLNDSLEFLVTDLALAAQSLTSSTISSLMLLSSVLEHGVPDAIFVDNQFLTQLLEELSEKDREFHSTLIVVGDKPLSSTISELPLRVLLWSELLENGSLGSQVQNSGAEPDDVFSIFYYENIDGSVKATQITHLNMTAGVTATRLLLPLNASISPSDTILSSHSLSTPFGRSIAYTAILDGANFATTDSTAIFHDDDDSPIAESGLKTSAKVPPATILFLTTEQLRSLGYRIIKAARESTSLYPVAWRHKLSALQQGFVTRDSRWDRLSFDSARKSVLQEMSFTLRGVIGSGGLLDARALSPARIALSVPLVNAHNHPLVVGPVFASHPLDLQAFPPQPRSADNADPYANIAHVGPPSVNIEAKLIGVNDAAVEGGANPIGELQVRGPSVTLPLDGQAIPHNWLLVGDRGLAQTNGTFKVLSNRYDVEKNA